MPFNGGDFGRLVFQRIEPVHIANQRLNGGDNQRHPQRHGEHRADGVGIVPSQQVPGCRRADEQRAAEESRHRHMQQAVRERRVKNHRQPVHRHHLTIDDLKSLRRLHPAIRCKDPEGGDNRPQRDHTGGEKVQARSDTVPAEQHHAEESGLKEEGGQNLIGQQRAGNAPGEFRESAPVGTELVGHHQAGDDPHAEVNGEDF